MSKQFRSTILDDVIGVFSPSAKLSRIATRAKIGILEDSVRKFNSASHSRRTEGWFAPSTSANGEIAYSLPVLRNRMRDLVRNNPTAKRAIQAVSYNAIGLGMRPSHSKQRNKSELKRLKDAWNNWADSTDCDWDGQNNYYGLQHLATRCMLESGAVLVRKRYNGDYKDGQVPLQLQILEPDFLDRTRNTGILTQNGAQTTPYDMHGIRFDADGKRLGYWLYRVHPGDAGNGESVFLPIDEVLHIYIKDRAGQIDGVPMLATSAMTMKDFDEYEQAQLIRQKIAACFAVFITDSDAGDLPSDQKDKVMPEKLEPGIIQRVKAGKTVSFTTPPTVSNYDEYATAMLRKIASGIGISYEVLTGDLSNVNFSSGRMGWIEFHRLIQHIQMLILVPQMCGPTYNWFLEAAKIVGIIRDTKLKATWTPPRREMIDPVKEVKALVDMIRSGLKPWDEAMREQGLDPEDAIESIIDSFKKLRKYDLFLTCDPKFDATRSNGALPEEPDLTDTVDGADEETGAQKKKMLKLNQS